MRLLHYRFGTSRKGSGRNGPRTRFLYHFFWYLKKCSGRNGFTTRFFRHFVGTLKNHSGRKGSKRRHFFGTLKNRSGRKGSNRVFQVTLLVPPQKNGHKNGHSLHLLLLIFCVLCHLTKVSLIIKVIHVADLNVTCGRLINSAKAQEISRSSFAVAAFLLD